MLNGALSIRSARPKSSRRSPGASSRSARTTTEAQGATWSASRLADPRPRGRAAPIKHALRDPREPHLRPGPRRPAAERRPEPDAFGRTSRRTPALARERSCCSTFYVDAEVSNDGHAYSMAAYATDAVDRRSTASAAGSTEEGPRDLQQHGNLAPADGYIWDFATRRGVCAQLRRVRVLGDEGRAGRQRSGRRQGITRAIRPTTCRFDNQRVDVWLRSSAASRRTRLPQLNIVRLGNDHTATPAVTPRAFVAENDLALGRLVERSRRAASGRSRRSSSWRTTPGERARPWTRTARCCWRASLWTARQRRLDALHHLGRAAHDGLVLGLPR